MEAIAFYKSGIDSSKMLVTAGLSFIHSQILRPDGTIRSSSLSSSENLLWFFPNNGCPCDAIRTYQHSIPGSVFQLSLCTVQPAYQLHEASFQPPGHPATLTFLRQRKAQRSRQVRREIKARLSISEKSPQSSSQKITYSHCVIPIETQPKFKGQTKNKNSNNSWTKKLTEIQQNKNTRAILPVFTLHNLQFLGIFYVSILKSYFYFSPFIIYVIFRCYHMTENLNNLFT